MHSEQYIKVQLGQPGQFAASEHTNGAAATVWAAMVTPPVVNFAQHINVAKYVVFHSGLKKRRCACFFCAGAGAGASAATIRAPSVSWPGGDAASSSTHLRLLTFERM